MTGTRNEICSALGLHSSRFYALVSLGDIKSIGAVPRKPGARGRSVTLYRVVRKSLLKGAAK